MKALRSDNGGEYISGEFKYFCSVEGIRRELIASHNPQQNGVAKWKNRTIVGVAQAMLHDQGLPPSLVGRSMQYNSLCAEPLSSQDTWHEYWD